MTQIIFNKRMTSAPRVNSKIFRLSSPAVTELKLFETARKFKLTGNPRLGEVIKTAEHMTYKENNLMVSVNKLSGATRFIDMNTWQVDDGESSVKFKENESVNIATEFISKNKLAASSEYKFLKNTKLEVGGMQKGHSPEPSRVIDNAVVFQRMINNIPVEGPGGKIIVYINANKEVTGCDMLWRDIAREYRKVSNRELKQPRSFETSLKLFGRRMAIPKLSVEDVRFGYFEQDYNTRQLYLQPVYIAPITISSNDNRFIMKSFYIFNASIKPVGRIKYPQVDLSRQPIRR